MGKYLFVINFIVSEAAIEPMNEYIGNNSKVLFLKDSNNVLKISCESSNVLLNVGFLICLENFSWFIIIGLLTFITVPFII